MAESARANEPVPPAAGAQPQTPKYPSYGIQVDPLSPLLGAALGLVAVKLELQLAFSDYVGLSIIPSFVWAKLTYDDDTVTALGFGVRAGPRIFPQGRRLDGAYVLPFVGYAYATASSGSTTLSPQAISVGAEAGYAWTWANGFSINLGGGLAYEYYLNDEPSRTLPISPVINFTLGYVW